MKFKVIDSVRECNSNDKLLVDGHKLEAIRLAPGFGLPGPKGSDLDPQPHSRALKCEMF